MLSKITDFFQKFIKRNNLLIENIGDLQGDECSLEAFVCDCEQGGKKVLFHITSQETAIKIVNSKSIYGVDTVSAAHFHGCAEMARNQALERGVTLGLVWSGKLKSTFTIDNPEGTTHQHRDCENTLIEVYNNSNHTDLWEYRIYPGKVDSLELLFISFQNQNIKLKESIDMEHITYPSGKKRL